MVAGAAVLAVALVVPAAAVVFSGGGGSDCGKAYDVLAQLTDAGARETSGLSEDQLADTQAYLVVGAPDCFPPSEVARAQQHIDMIRSR